MLAGNEQGMMGVKKLRELFSWAATSGVTTERIALDLSIARGLDYYTGTIYETFLSRLTGDRQRLLRRPLRQPGRPLHEPETSRRARASAWAQASLTRAELPRCT